MNMPCSPVMSSGSTPTPPFLAPPVKRPCLATSRYPVIVLDTNVATMILNGMVLRQEGDKRDQLLAINPTWCDMIGPKMELSSFVECRRALQMSEWALANMGECSLRITTTVLSELMSANAVSFTCINQVVFIMIRRGIGCVHKHY